MKARARVVAGPGGPYTAAVLRSDLPIVLRPADDAIYLAQGAAGPLNGDDIELSIDVPDGCSLRLRAVASTLVLPSINGGVARIRVRATVGAGGSLELLLEPVVVADQACVELVTDVVLAEDATLLWREEVVLGRHGEQGGEVTSRVDVTRNGTALLRNGFHLVGSSRTTYGPAVLGGARAVGSLLGVGYDLTWEQPTTSAAVLSLAGGGELLTALAPSAIVLRRLLDLAALMPATSGPCPRPAARHLSLPPARPARTARSAG